MKEDRDLNIIIGTSHSGKSTIAKALADSETKIRLSADQIRSSIRFYNKNNPEHCRIRDHVFEISLDAYLSSSAFDIFCEIPRSLISMVSSYIDKAGQYGFSARIVFLDASTEKLLERFNASVRHSRNKGFTLAVATEKDFIDNLSESRQLIKQLKQNVVIEKLPHTEFNTTGTTSEMIIQGASAWIDHIDRNR